MRRDWSRSARSSDARWILWHEGPAAGLPEFEDPEVFAVSGAAILPGLEAVAVPNGFVPHIAARGGQPGPRAARVRAILVDRRKLLALGIPQCSLTGTAWMILFWKAAAAGWRSYSVGQASHTPGAAGLPDAGHQFPGQPVLRQAVTPARPARPRPLAGHHRPAPACRIPACPTSQCPARLALPSLPPFARRCRPYL